MESREDSTALNLNPKHEEYTEQRGPLSIFNSTRIILNVGGKKHDVRWKTLEKHPSSRLGKIRYAQSVNEILALCDEVDFDKNEIYFDRPARAFNAIIDYYRTGKLHSANEMCIISFYEDLTYWGIDDNFFEPCCNFNYHQLKENAFDEIVKIDEFEKADELAAVSIEFGRCCPDSRRKVWDIMENPETSLIAKIVTIVSIFFVITSTITLVLSTIEGLKTVVQIPISNGNYSNGTNTSAFSSKTELVDHPIFEFIEIVCIAWFTLEYVLRIWSSPHRWQSFKSPLNIIDFISIVPFYLSIIIDHSSAGEASETDSARKIFTLFRILRVLRIFKLARHSKGLKAFGQTIEKSSDEFGLLFFFLSIQVLLFSSLVYFAEREEDGTQFTSIPATSWWAVISITTVGYGDMTPTTPLGKFIGAFCCISGILVIATPIPIIVNNFSEICINQNKKEKVVKYKNEREQRLLEIEEAKLTEQVPLLDKSQS